MDDLDKYLNEQMNDPEFMKQWQESQKEFDLEEKQILKNINKNPAAKCEVGNDYLVSAI